MSGRIPGYIPGVLEWIRGGVSVGICLEIWWIILKKEEGSLFYYEEAL